MDGNLEVAARVRLRRDSGLKHLAQIGNEIFRVFDPHRVTDEPLGNPQGLALLGSELYVTRRGGRAGYCLHRDQVRGQVRVLEPRQETSNAFELSLQLEAEDAAEAIHLAPRELMVRTRLEPRIVDLIDGGMFFEEAGDLEGAGVLLADAEMQSLPLAGLETTPA